MFPNSTVKTTVPKVSAESLHVKSRSSNFQVLLAILVVLVGIAESRYAPSSYTVSIITFIKYVLVFQTVLNRINFSGRIVDRSTEFILSEPRSPSQRIDGQGKYE